jgi:hypothetical protein
LDPNRSLTPHDSDSSKESAVMSTDQRTDEISDKSTLSRSETSKERRAVPMSRTEEDVQTGPHWPAGQGQVSKVQGRPKTRNRTQRGGAYSSRSRIEQSTLDRMLASDELHLRPEQSRHDDRGGPGRARTTCPSHAVAGCGAPGWGRSSGRGAACVLR